MNCTIVEDLARAEKRILAMQEEILEPKVGDIPMIRTFFGIPTESYVDFLQAIWNHDDPAIVFKKIDDQASRISSLEMEVRDWKQAHDKVRDERDELATWREKQ